MSCWIVAILTMTNVQDGEAVIMSSSFDILSYIREAGIGYLTMGMDPNGCGCGSAFRPAI